MEAVVQGNSRKGVGRCRLSCLLHYINYVSIPLHTTSCDDISRTLIVNSPVVDRDKSKRDWGKPSQMM